MPHGRLALPIRKLWESQYNTDLARSRAKAVKQGHDQPTPRGTRDALSTDAGSTILHVTTPTRIELRLFFFWFHPPSNRQWVIHMSAFLY